MTEPARFPTRYVRLDEARARYGHRVDSLGRCLLQGDPLADAVVDALHGKVRAEREALLDRCLDHGIDAVKDAPDVLRAFFAEVDAVPFWADYDRMDRGGAVFLRSGILGGLVLGAASLVAGYCSPAGNKPLVFTGRLNYETPRRLGETTRFVQACSLAGGMRRHGDGFKAMVKVRLMHASVRRMLQRSERWREREWGVPINQADMAGTTLLFSWVALDALAKLGFVATPDERADFLHLWRYGGYLLGVREELRCATEAEAATLWEMLKTTQEPPDDDARALANALILGMNGRFPEGERERRIAFGYDLSRYLIGDQYADWLGYPKSSFARVFPVVKALGLGVSGAALSSERVRKAMVRLGERYWQNTVEISLGDKPTSFPMADRLREA